LKVPTFVLGQVARDLTPERGELACVEVFTSEPQWTVGGPAYNAQRVEVIVDGVQLVGWVRVSRKAPIAREVARER
jgi:hypothetical protein